MKKIAGLLCLIVILFLSVQAQAQQIATIGLGDISVSAKNELAQRSSSDLLRRLNNDINKALADTRKFSVLDYTQLNARLAEQGRNLKGYYAKQYSGNAIWQEGLDFILKADVSEFNIIKSNTDAAGATTVQLNLDFQLFGVADVTYDFKSRATGQVSSSFNVNNEAALLGVLNSATDKSIEQLVDKIVSSLLPVQIVKVVDDEDQQNFGDITLNYGDGFLNVGDTILIYAPETENVIDETGKAIGEAVTSLRVVSTNQKFSIARSLDIEKIQRGEARAPEKGQKGRLLLSRRR